MTVLQVGAGWLANVVWHSELIAADLPPSGASPLPQVIFSGGGIAATKKPGISAGLGVRSNTYAAMLPAAMSFL